MGKRDKKSKKCKKEKTKKPRRSSSSSSSSSAEEWVEKESAVKFVARDAWMSLPSAFATSSNETRRVDRAAARRKEQEANKYDPRSSTRELNPYWKGGGDGLPSPAKFKKPSEEDAHDPEYKRTSRRANWRKPSESSAKQHETLVFKSESPPPTDYAADTKEHSDSLTDKEMNDIAAKIIKAEILGNAAKVEALRDKLNRARDVRASASVPQEEDVLLLRTDAKGFCRPLSEPTEANAGRKKTKKRTHEDGHRLRYFADDDTRSLQQVFEQEKRSTADEQDAEFLALAAQARRTDDMDDIFLDKIRNERPTSNRAARDRAIHEHERMDSCQQCVQSASMPKHLVVALGATVYLSLPAHEPLTDGHCLLIPHRHVPCATQLDENEWSEVGEFRRALAHMFLARDEHVVFYETVLNSHAYSHMVIHCVPVPREQGDLAPIYFKKAIDECESEWATNRKLIELAGRDVRRAVPRGLPYFFVSFGLVEGFAHVIEDQRDFPRYFAAEVIGGMLDVHHSRWRNPRNENFDRQRERVLHFSSHWKPFDCTSK